jgi:hypothetical protein
MSWKKVRAAVMFGIACLTSPCCTPLIVPLLIGLLAGTPAAVWITHNVGLIYGLLTLISVISLILALRWMNKRQSSQPAAIQPSNQTEA